MEHSHVSASDQNRAGQAPETVVTQGAVEVRPVRTKAELKAFIRPAVEPVQRLGKLPRSV
jgi:hypothetical protein